MKESIGLLVRGIDISAEKMQAAMLAMMSGEANPATVAAFLTALSIKGESVEEVVAAVGVMRELAQKITLPPDIYVDIVGTGGDGANLFNVSTAAAIIASAGGVKIAKHGNIAAGSTSGSADFLREAGVKLALTPEQVISAIQDTNFAFIFAQAYHQAMRHIVPVRRAIGIRTIFNVLGPLCNPAGVKHQVLGVFSRVWLRPLAEVMRELGSEHVILVCSQNGLDEFSVTHPNDVCELMPDGSIHEYIVPPKDFNMHYENHDALRVNSSQESLALIQSVFDTATPEIGLDMLALNAGAVFYIAGKTKDLHGGVVLAKEIITDKRAAKQLQRIVDYTQAIGG